MMAQLEPLYDKDYTCHLCGHTFSSKKVRSRFVKIISFDTDFAPSYASTSENPNVYFVHVCPKCGFSFTDEFSSYFPPGTKEDLDKKVSSQWIPHEFSGERSIEDAVKTYKLGSYCSVLKKEKHIVTAGLYIRTAWLYRSQKNMEQESRFLKLALHEYIESYSTGDYKGTQVSEDRLMYLIGELSRRTGNSQDAVRFFSKVIERQKQSFEPNITQMAKDRWQEMRAYQQQDN